MPMVWCGTYCLEPGGDMRLVYGADTKGQKARVGLFEEIAEDADRRRWKFENASDDAGFPKSDAKTGAIAPTDRV